MHMFACLCAAISALAVDPNETPGLLCDEGECLSWGDPETILGGQEIIFGNSEAPDDESVDTDD